MINPSRIRVCSVAVDANAEAADEQTIYIIYKY
jgi:hypothetical protein